MQLVAYLFWQLWYLYSFMSEFQYRHTRMVFRWIKEDQVKLTLQMVSDWIQKTGGHCSRLSFFSILPKSQFYTVLVEPLLSLRTTGSITVERIAKPMKHKVLEKHRNRLGIQKAEMLLRVGFNLRAIMATSLIPI